MNNNIITITIYTCQSDHLPIILYFKFLLLIINKILDDYFMFKNQISNNRLITIIGERDKTL